METNLFGNIQIRTKGRSRIATQALVLVLLCTTIYAFYSFDYKDVRMLGMISLPSVYFLGKGEISRVFIQQKEGMAHNKPITFLKEQQVRKLINTVKDGVII